MTNVLIGAAAVAALSIAAQVFMGWRGRRLDRSVAARAILGDLYVSGAMLDLISKFGVWPDRLDLDAPLATWREFRAPLAAGLRAWEWALVDSFYGELARTRLMVDLGQPLGPGEEDVVRALAERLPEVQRIVAEHSTRNEGERRRIIKILGSGGRSGAPDPGDQP